MSTLGAVCRRAWALHDSKSRGILSLTTIPVDDSRLEPLWYTGAEKLNFERRVPAHIENTAVNHDLWLRFRNTFSQVEVDVEARCIHLYPELVIEGNVFLCKR